MCEQMVLYPGGGILLNSKKGTMSMNNNVYESQNNYAKRKKADHMILFI